MLFLVRYSIIEDNDLCNEGCRSILSSMKYLKGIKALNLESIQNFSFKDCKIVQKCPISFGKYLKSLHSLEILNLSSKKSAVIIENSVGDEIFGDLKYLTKLSHLNISCIFLLIYRLPFNR